MIDCRRRVMLTRSRAAEYLASPNIMEPCLGVYARTMFVLYTGDAWETIERWSMDGYVAPSQVSNLKDDSAPVL